MISHPLDDFLNTMVVDEQEDKPWVKIVPWIRQNLEFRE
jgi:hypothetical protein